MLQELIPTPLKRKDGDIQALLLIGLYQLEHTRIPDHAALSATVDACRLLHKDWAAGLINGVLRRYQREQAQLAEKFAKTPITATPTPSGCSIASAPPGLTIGKKP